MNTNEVLEGLQNYSEARICGSTALVTGSWGREITNADIIARMNDDFRQRIKNAPQDRSKLETERNYLEERIEATGFNVGYQFGFDEDILSDRVQSGIHARVGAAMLYRAAQMRGWLKRGAKNRGYVDEFIFTSVSSRPGLENEIVREVNKLGITIGRVTKGQTACASTLIGLGNLVKFLEKDRRGFYLGENSLSGSAVAEFDYEIPAIFHNQAGGLAVEGSDAEFLKDKEGKDLYSIRIKDDKRGVIRLPQFFDDFPETSEPCPDFVEIIEGSENTYAFSNGGLGIYKTVPRVRDTEDEKDKAKMDGILTAIDFREFGGEILRDKSRGYEGEGLAAAIVHPPSAVVLNHIIKRYKKFKGEDPTLPEIYISWDVIAGKRSRNSSDVTTMNYMLGLIEKKLLKPETDVPIFAVGVGHVGVAGGIRWKRPK